MTFYYKILLFLFCAQSCSAFYSALSYEDRPCGNDLFKLWLDVMAVVDTSQGMTNAGLDSIAVNIARVFSDGTRIGINHQESRTTRLGIVTYNSNVTVAAGINKYQSNKEVYTSISNDLGTLNPNYESYLALGLLEADNVFRDDGITGFRGNYKKVMIVYASNVNSAYDLNSVATRLKNNGVTIITVALDWGNDPKLLEDLAQIASRGASFSHTDSNIVKEIQGALLQANCYCPRYSIQYRASYSDPSSYKFGVCLSTDRSRSDWQGAQYSCRSQKGYLVNEYNQAKHDFVLQYVRGIHGELPPYHIGLSKIDGFWKWDQPNGLVHPYLKNWYDWAEGFPNASFTTPTAPGVMNQQSGLDSGWQNFWINYPEIYVCEMIACDTDTYCNFM